jgi:hypothetical protein
MKKINLKGISEILSEKELKDVMGGVTQQSLMARDADSSGGGGGVGECYTMPSCDVAGDCNGRVCGDACVQSSTGRLGTCIIWAFGWKTCKTCAVGMHT